MVQGTSLSQPFTQGKEKRGGGRGRWEGGRDEREGREGPIKKDITALLDIYYRNFVPMKIFVYLLCATNCTAICSDPTSEKVVM